ncbi:MULTISPECIES: LLM class flavin-dependent oxidoreductase [Streptomyces]|uniref:LLM class flavin-dependent oxidoreductase n=2 Tax=Streptomyces rimosus subsp. rimosus TaxID=132474 RepID=L8EUF9_STRR1|nr:MULTISPECIES: LLM class flavin-dependent oxidoreductase [Streptomyces]KOG70982.1 alkanesulfonate monooxygenase [Kitasatospora aureofaciens]MYT45565.1 LLM class flavin-dependent oxidoreductase [Streptomyces sp. SID5471]KEF08819.1 alkanesulfonate monooxygenase [Streptomyces rimosus]KEF12214.1 alkanesulfonate monooxygenase [Streptomyces rimosus]KUJ27569.1 alkanesulfonate monooxygenase [Streptomyces rimosus subsp. rimosus]
MTVHLHWFLPTGGDGRTLVDRHAYTDGGVRRERITPVSGVRAPDIDYLAQIAKAAEQLGFEAVLTPTGTWCEDAWLTTAALTQVTDRLKFLVAFRPGVISPVLAAQMAATYQRISGGRLLLNVVTGGDSTEQRRFGDGLDHDRRYARTDEFLQVVRGVWGGAPFDFHGEHYQVEGGLTALPPDPLPEIFFGGSSAAAGPVAARNVDVYLTWGEPPEQVKQKIDWIAGLAAREGRTVRFGIRLHTISRDSAKDAWATANRLLDDLDPDTVAAAQQALGRSESVGQQRMLALHGGSRDKLEIAPNLWAGVGLVRGGAGTALVGSHAEVADRIEEYHALGIEHFVLSGYPHLEEAYWFGEGVRPELAARGLLPGGVGTGTGTGPDPLSGVPAAIGRPASAPGGAPLLVAGGR